MKTGMYVIVIIASFEAIRKTMAIPTVKVQSSINSSEATGQIITFACLDSKNAIRHSLQINKPEKETPNPLYNAPGTKICEIAIIN